MYSITLTNTFYIQATVVHRKGELTRLQKALSDADIDRQRISKELEKAKEKCKLLGQQYLSSLTRNENPQSEVSQIEYMQNQVAQLRQEALQWTKELEIKNAELTKLKGSTQEMVKLKEDVETLRKEDAGLKGDVKAQRVQVNNAACTINVASLKGILIVYLGLTALP